MKLNEPIVITPPPITNKEGVTKTFEPITINELDITIIDNNKNKHVMAVMQFCPRPLTLWSKEEYDLIGDYTQNQVESRVLELLGSDPQKTLEDLFLPPTRG